MNHDIVACARGWIGTRFHHQGRLKKSATHKGGVDCLGLLTCVAKELDLRDKNGNYFALADETHYAHYPDTDRMHAILSSLMHPVALDDIAEGDVVVFRIDDRPQHLGIASDIGIIHAYAPAKGVVEHAIDGWWRERMDCAFRHC
jgi:cell wall-associated NlpC family hydrolase